MAYPLMDKTSSYIAAYGFYDSSGEIMSPITAINRGVDAFSGVTVTTAATNKLIYGSASRKMEFTAISVYNGLVLTSVTALGLASVANVWADPAQVSGLMTTDIWVNVWATQSTAINFKVVYSTGADVAALGALKVNLYGLGVK